MHTNFPLLFIQILIWGALIWTLAGAVTLIILLIKDWKNKSIW
jgi:hypothetical protein